MPKGIPEAGNRCGTIAGATRHYREGEPLCDACRAAKAEYDEKRNGQTETWAKQRHAGASASLAATRLRQAHPTLYRRLYDEAKAELAPVYLGDDE